MAERLASLLLDGLAPRRCGGCGRPDASVLCAACHRRCLDLSRPGTWPGEHGPLRAAFHYEPPVRDLVCAAKYGCERAAMRVLAALAVERLALDLRCLAAGAAPAAVVPVPLGRRRRRGRGFNQARVLAEAVADVCALPLLDRLVRRRETAPQAGRDRARRRLNVAGAFAWRGHPLQGTVLLVDDVVTTGATLSAAAVALKQAGASRIEAVAALRSAPWGA